LLLSAALAATAGMSFAAAYLLWPRPMTAGDWVARRREADGVGLRQPASAGRGSSSLPEIPRIPGFVRLARDRSRDLALLRLTETGLPTDEAGLRRRLRWAVSVAAGAGLAAGLAVHVARGFVGFPALALLLPVAAGLGAPALLLRLVVARARGVRDTVDLNLPRVLTGARMLLESGATTPEKALLSAAALYDDPATAILREAGRVREVEFVSIDVALDRVAGFYGMPALARLADAYRIAAQYGTGMAGVLADYAESLRQKSEAEERSRITSAPVRMVAPIVFFFLSPLLAIILAIAYGQLLVALSQL
jgi:Flp pilus assembly protein TadB